MQVVADIGATNARFGAVVAGGDPARIRVYPTAGLTELARPLREYAEEVGVNPTEAAVAVATPVSGDRVAFTNCPLQFSIRETRAALGLERLIVLNDFEALALSLPNLRGPDLEKTGGAQPNPSAPCMVLGPGSGLGMAGLVRCDERYLALPGEGGHVEFAPQTEREIALLRELACRFGHVSIERLLSGPGLENIHAALRNMDGLEEEALSARDITRRGLSGDCGVCVETLDIFCAVLGSAAGNAALTLGAAGGVFIGGGIVPKLGDFFRASQFRARFEEKGRFRAYLRPIPTHTILHDYPALLGAAATL